MSRQGTRTGVRSGHFARFLAVGVEAGEEGVVLVEDVLVASEMTEMVVRM
jgi:hypothetical protein